MSKMSRLCVVIAFVGLTIDTCASPMILDMDLLHECALAREILEQGSVPWTDSFAFTPTVNPVVHHEWGMGILLYSVSVSTGWGEAGIVALKLGLALLLVGFCVTSCQLRGGRLSVISLMMVLGFMLFQIRFGSTIRAELLSMVLLSALNCMLALNDRGVRWWMPVWIGMYLIWLNMHAGFLVGAGLFAIYTLGTTLQERRSGLSIREAIVKSRALWWLGCLMVVLIFINPFHVHYYEYLWRAVRLKRELVHEWRPLWRASDDLSWLCRVASLYLISLVLAIYSIWKNRKIRWGEIMIFMIPAVLAIRQTRYITTYSVMWCCLIPAWLTATPLGQRIESMWEKRSTILCSLVFAVGCLGLLAGIRYKFWDVRIPGIADRDPQRQFVYPVGPVEYLAEQQFEGTLWTHFNHGSYVMWKLGPRVKISMDSRYEVAYDPQLMLDSHVFYRADGDWENFLQEHMSDAILLRKSSSLSDKFAEEETVVVGEIWRQVYEDPTWVVVAQADIAEDWKRVSRHQATIEGSFP